MSYGCIRKAKDRLFAVGCIRAVRGPLPRSLMPRSNGIMLDHKKMSNHAGEHISVRSPAWHSIRHEREMT